MLKFAKTFATKFAKINFKPKEICILQIFTQNTILPIKLHITYCLYNELFFIDF